MKTEPSTPQVTVAVTGASGFVGRALVGALALDPRYSCRALHRTMPNPIPSGAEAFVTGDLQASTDLAQALVGVDVVVHSAGRAHFVGERRASLAAYRDANVSATRVVAESAAAAGVKRIVYLSSIKVNGERTPIDRPFTSSDFPAPEDSYGVTKWEAERSLWEIAAHRRMEAVVLRLPLVYGPGAKGNLERLTRAIARGLPLPLGAIRNLRSMISLENLVSATISAASHPAAAGQTFLVSDQRDVSTPDLIRLIAANLGRPALLFSVPTPLLEAALVATGRRSLADRLVHSLRVDSTPLTEATGWRPGMNLEASISKMTDVRARPTRR